MRNLEDLGLLAMAWIDAESEQDGDLLTALIDKRNELAVLDQQPLPRAWQGVLREYEWLRGHLTSERMDYRDAWICLSAVIEQAISGETQETR